MGAPADIVALDPAHPALAGTKGDTLLDAWIFAARHGAVASVWRGGRQCVADGRHIAAQAVADRYRATVASLLA